MENPNVSSETGQKPESNESGEAQVLKLTQTSADAVQAETIVIDHSSANSVRAGSVHIEWGSANTIEGDTVSIEMGSANTVTADHLTIRQGGVVKADVQQLEMIQGGIVLAQAETAHLTTAQATFLSAQGDVKMDQSGAQALHAGGNVTMNQSGAVVMIAQDVKADKSGVVFLFARKIEVNVKAMFGPRESILFGVVAGLVTGVVLLVSRQIKQHKRS